MLYREIKPAVGPFLTSCLYLATVSFVHLFLWLCDGLSSVANIAVFAIEGALVSYIVLWIHSSYLYKQKVKAAKRRLERIPGYRSIE